MDSAHLTSEGDTNTDPERVAWKSPCKHEDTLTWLVKDGQRFMHEALSSPCLDVIESSAGVYNRVSISAFDNYEKGIEQSVTYFRSCV